MAVYILRSTWIFSSIFLPSPPVCLYISLYLPNSLSIPLPLSLSLLLLSLSFLNQLLLLIYSEAECQRAAGAAIVCLWGSAVVYGPARDKSCFPPLWEDGGEKWRSMDRWYTGTRIKKEGRKRSRQGRRGLLFRFSSSCCSGSVFIASLSFSSSTSAFLSVHALTHMHTPIRLLHLIITRGVFFPLAQCESSWL